MYTHNIHNIGKYLIEVQSYKKDNLILIIESK